MKFIALAALVVASADKITRSQFMDKFNKVRSFDLVDEIKDHMRAQYWGSLFGNDSYAWDWNEDDFEWGSLDWSDVSSWDFDSEYEPQEYCALDM